MCSHRSREEERASKPGTVSPPVKHAEDRAPKAVEEAPMERNEKAAATLPGEPQGHRVQRTCPPAAGLPGFRGDFKVLLVLLLLLLLLQLLLPALNLSVTSSIFFMAEGWHGSVGMHGCFSRSELLMVNSYSQ